VHIRNAVVVAHKFHTTPEDDLIAYLNASGAVNVLHICHSFSDAPDRRSSYRWYRNGKLLKQGHTRDYRFLPEPLIYLKEFVSTLRWVAGSFVKWDRFVGMDGLCTLFGLVLRLGGRVSSVNYWNIDLVPEARFPQRWKDSIYRRVNRFSSLRANEMWDHTDLMVTEKERILGLSPSDYRRHRVVPLGVWTDRMRPRSYQECHSDTLVFMGHLLEKQGVQNVIRAIPRIIEQIPTFRFKVIGGGVFEPELRKLADSLGVDKYVIFCGRIEQDEVMEEEVAQCGAGIAPYIRDLDTFTQFGADPGKVKIYLSCGLPILLTDVPWIASEIQARECGTIISEDIDDIATKVINILTDRATNQRCRDNAVVYAREFDARRIFDGLSL